MPDYIKMARTMEKQQAYRDAAEFYMLAGEYAQAIPIWHHLNDLQRVAECYECMGEIKEAVEYYTRIEDYDHAAELLRESGDLFHAALMFKRGKRFREAASMFESSGVISESAHMLELEQEFQLAGELYLKAHMYQSAALCFERAGEKLLSENGGVPHETIDYRNFLYRAIDAWKKVPDLRNAATLLGRLADWRESGFLYEQCNEPERAVHAYLQANEMDSAIRLLARTPDNTSLAPMIMQHAVKLGHLSTAATIAKQMGWYDQAARYFKETGNFREAAVLFEKTGDYAMAADMYSRIGNTEKAAEMYESAGDSESAARLYIQLGVEVKALKVLARNHQYLKAGQLCLVHHKYSAAIRLLDRIPQDHPSYSYAQKLIGIARLRNGDIEKARPILNPILRKPISQFTIDVYYEYAKALLDAEQIDESMRILKAVVDFDMRYRDARKLLNWCAALQEEIAAEILDVTVGELPIGLVINSRYKLQSLLGKGSNSVVYRARDREFHQDVALKILRPKYSFDPEFVAMFQREVTLAQKLAHPNIIRVYQLSRGGRLWFVSMELLTGQELRMKISQEGALPVSLIHQIACQLLAALEYSHRNFIFHCDIKPGNIFIDSRNTPILMDFGIAWASDFQHDDKIVYGTPGYVAPERIFGEPASASTDLYSLGVTLFESITGSMLYEGTDFEAILREQVYGSVPAPRDLRPEIPEWMNEMILRLIEPNPAHRYPSAGDVLAEIPEPY